MKNTKVCLVVIATLVATWFIFGLIGAFITSDSIRTCMSDYGMVFPMIFIGWIPAVIVAVDYSNHINNK